jgi:hypothetical protein
MMAMISFMIDCLVLLRIASKVSLAAAGPGGADYPQHNSTIVPGVDDSRATMANEAAARLTIL